MQPFGPERFEVDYRGGYEDALQHDHEGRQNDGWDMYVHYAIGGMERAGWTTRQRFACVERKQWEKWLPAPDLCRPAHVASEYGRYLDTGHRRTGTRVE